MKRLSKMLALGLAAALVFGMTVQAAGSPDAGNSGASSEALKEAASVSNTVVVDGKEVSVEFEAPTVLEEAKLAEVKEAVTTQTVVDQVQEAVKKVTEVAANQTLTFVGKPEIKAAFNLEAPKGLSDADIKKGVKIPFTLKEVKANAVYSVLHYFADGSYEVLPATISGNTIYATFTSFSPIVIVEQEVKVDTKAPAQGDNNNNNNSNNNDSNNSSQGAAVSPKTGEAVPVAGIMALVLMAGAVICAKKARYNR